MRKRWMAFLLAAALLVTGIFAGNAELKAAAPEEDYEVSYLALEDTLVGYMDSQTRGVYLMSGASTINDAGNNRIGCGGETNAAKRCAVSVQVTVEKKVNGSWTRLDSFYKEATNALTVVASKYLYVTSGSYYRVRSYHVAGTDSSASYTDALLMQYFSQYVPGESITAGVDAQGMKFEIKK